MSPLRACPQGTLTRKFPDPGWPVHKGRKRPELSVRRISGNVSTSARTSSGAFFTGTLARHPLVLQTISRLETLMQYPELTTRGCTCACESLQVVHYAAGEFYTPHYDNRRDGTTRRAATYLGYLNNVDSGGCTVFPRAKGVDVRKCRKMIGVEMGSEGLRIHPVQGRAVLFWSWLPDGWEDRCSLHAAEAPASGEKWLLTQWFQLRQ